MNAKARQRALKARGGLLRLIGPILRAGSVPPVASADRIRNILFIRTDRIGDMVLSIPAIRALKRLYPAARLTVLASPANHCLLRHEECVDETIVIDTNNPRKLRQALSTLRQLRRHRYDLVVDPLVGHDLNTALVAFASGALLRLGFSNAGREVFFTNPVPNPGEERHIAAVTLELVGELGNVGQHPRLSVRLTGEEILSARQRLSASVPQGTRLVGIHPGAHYPSQRWPVEHFIDLAARLKRQAGVALLLLGGPTDAPLVEAIERSLPAPTAAFIGADLRFTAAIISHLEVLVCNNSGPLHLATALGVPTVSFMGPTNAAQWWPLGGFNIVLRAAGLDCLGCKKGICPKGTNECLTEIDAAQAFDQVSGLLAQNRRRAFL